MALSTHGEWGNFPTSVTQSLNAGLIVSQVLQHFLWWTNKSISMKIAAGTREVSGSQGIKTSPVFLWWAFHLRQGQQQIYCSECGATESVCWSNARSPSLLHRTGMDGRESWWFKMTLDFWRQGKAWLPTCWYAKAYFRWVSKQWVSCKSHDHWVCMAAV